MEVTIQKVLDQWEIFRIQRRKERRLRERWKCFYLGKMKHLYINDKDFNGNEKLDHFAKPSGPSIIFLLVHLYVKIPFAEKYHVTVRTVLLDVVG